MAGSACGLLGWVRVSQAPVVVLADVEGCSGEGRFEGL